MNTAILATEIFGMIALAIIVYGSWFESKDRSVKGKAFALLSAAVFFNLFIDAISYIHFDWVHSYWIHFVVTLLAFITPLFVYAVFLQYLYIHMSQKTKVPKTLFRIGIAYCGVGVVSSIYYALQGMLFVLENGHYLPGEYYEGYLMTYIVVLAYTILLVLTHIRKTGFHDAIAAIMFLLIPVAFVVIDMYVGNLAFEVPAMSLSMIVVNTMLQAERENTLATNNAIATARAHTDELTGLNNRLAFSEKIDNFDENCNVGIVFADLNGLKYANDNFGHKAGDKLICEFSEILLDCFKKSSIFRISGDEFVVILTNVSENELDRQAGLLDMRIAEHEYQIASYGKAYGNSSRLSSLIDMAEDNMYEAKKKFHEQNPIYSRS